MHHTYIQSFNQTGLEVREIGFDFFWKAWPKGVSAGDCT